jgi:opacity protein-like surface antigen
MTISRFGLAAATLAAAACLSASAFADGMPRRSMKDAPVVVTSPHHCYFRGDVGYSWSRDPDVKWTVTDAGTGNFITDAVTDVQIDNTWLIEGGFGCGSIGGRGLRGELMLGWHGKRDIDGTPGPWNPGPPPPNDPLHTSVSTTTLMFNGYYDLGRFDRFTPYVGAGVGVAYNKTDEVYFTGNPFLTNRIEGDSRWSLAWALMAGVGMQLTDRITLDLGYRYLDMGKAQSGHYDDFTPPQWNPRVRIDDLAAHEFKIGLRFGFGGDCCSVMK